MKGRSGLRRRIVVSTAVISAVAMAAMIGTILLALNAVTNRTVESTLQDRFSVLSSGIANDTRGPGATLETPGDSIDDTTWLFDTNGRQIEGPDAKKRIQDEATRLRSVTTMTASSKGERAFLAAPVTIGRTTNSPGVLVVSQSLAPYEATRTLVLIGLGLLGLLVTVGTTAIAAWTITRTLEPVTAMAGLAEDWSAHDLDARFDDSPSSDEISHLGRTLNLLLDRVASALRGEQRLTSELAHELRTPLSAIRGEAELALMGEPDQDTQQRLVAVVALTDRMGSTIRTLLDLARNHQPGDHHTTTLEQVITTALADQPTNGRHIHVTSSPPEIWVAATTDLGVRALGPLIDNAIRHSATRVDIDVSIKGRQAAIAVADDGPGIRTPDAESLFNAGFHGDSSPGAGLGLALARRVARTLGGDVTLTSINTPTTFTLTIPQR